MVGNGQELPINKVGNVSVCCEKGGTHLKLNQTPKISRSLVSISKLTIDNGVVVEFDACRCNVKDKQTGQILARGIQRDGLYELCQSRPR